MTVDCCRCGRTVTSVAHIVVDADHWDIKDTSGFVRRRAATSSMPTASSNNAVISFAATGFARRGKSGLVDPEGILRHLHIGFHQRLNTFCDVFGHSSFHL
jgi:hypothetical protein